MDIKLEDINTGYLLTIKPGEHQESQKYAFEDFTDVLGQILMDCGPSQSRYQDDRIYIIKAPGDKNEKFSECHDKVIFPEEGEE